MRFFCTIFTYLSLFSVSLVNGQTIKEAKIECTVDREYWEVCESGEGECQPLKIERNSKQDNVLLTMPCGGTLTTVHLTKVGQEEPIMSLNISHEDCPPTFDLTGLEDGQYGAYMLACGLGGPIKLILITKSE